MATVRGDDQGVVEMMPAGYLLPRADREQRELRAYSMAEFNDDECDWLRCSAGRRNGGTARDWPSSLPEGLPKVPLTRDLDSGCCEGMSGGVRSRISPSKSGNP